MRAPVVGLLALASTPGVCAQNEAQNAAALFKRLCMGPPTEWIEVGQADAAANGWKLNAALSGRKYGLVASEAVKNSEAPVFDTRTWDFQEPGSSNVTVTVSVIGPEWPKLKFNVCTISLASSNMDDLLSKTAKATGYVAGDSKIVFGGKVRGWLVENAMTGNWGKLEFVGVSPWGEKASRSFIARMQWDIPESKDGMPHQGIMP